MKKNNDESVLQCKSTKEKNDVSASSIKYDEKIRIEEFTM
jgi:hypothetical protein